MPGSIARLPGDAEGPGPNAVTQARALQAVFDMPKGHWPAGADPIGERIDLDVPFMTSRLDEAAGMAFRESRIIAWT